MYPGVVPCLLASGAGWELEEAQPTLWKARVFRFSAQDDKPGTL
jgi:hypothetical protein